MPVMIDAMPELRQICWNRRTDMVIEDVDALALYERNWSLVDLAAMIPAERAYFERLVATVGHGVLMAA